MTFSPRWYRTGMETNNTSTVIPLNSLKSGKFKVKRKKKKLGLQQQNENGMFYEKFIFLFNLMMLM